MKVKGLWREDQVIVTRTYVGDGIDAITFDSKPLVTLVPDRVLREELAVRLLSYHGYRVVDRVPECMAWRYVRPLPLWLLHKAGHALYIGFWQACGWLYRRGILRLACAEGERARIWDFRLWPFKGRG